MEKPHGNYSIRTLKLRFFSFKFLMLSEIVKSEDNIKEVEETLLVVFCFSVTCI